MASSLPVARHVSELPAEFHDCFSFRYFNPVQSESLDVAFSSDANLLISAPTGCGKTAIMELALCRLISVCRNSTTYLAAAPNNQPKTPAVHSSHNPHNTDPMQSRVLPSLNKAIYIAPTKALVQEKAMDWMERFRSLHVRVAEVTGDSSPDRPDACQNSDIICTTAEKLDSLTRNRLQKGDANFFGEVGLVLIDEIHLLAENRGSTLEVVVARMMMLAGSPGMEDLPISRVRFVAVSATVPNAADVATWLHVPSEGLRIYGDEMRPVQLETVVRGYHRPRTDFLLEQRLTEHLPAVLREYSSGRPALIFCSSRKGASDAAAYIANVGANCGLLTHSQMQILTDAAKKTKNKALQSAIPASVGFHHAGMEASDRLLVETLFRDRVLQVLCTTSTLALGVNLPAYLVVIKGTRMYVGLDSEKKSGYREYDRSACLQMIGRAGRPQFDTKGVAVIMTTIETYDQLFYDRYIVSHANKLVEHDLAYRPAAVGLSPTQLGMIMSSHSIRFQTMLLIMDVQQRAGLPDLLRVVTRSEELSNIRLRRGEKTALNQLNRSDILTHAVMDPEKPNKKILRIKGSDQKLFILLSALLCDGDALAGFDYSIRQEAEESLRTGRRIIAGMVPTYIHMQRFSATANALLLKRSMQNRLWHSTKQECRQMSNIGRVHAERLAGAGLGSLKALLAADPRAIERAAQRGYPFGNQLQSEVRCRVPPTVVMTVDTTDLPRGAVRCCVTLVRHDSIESQSAQTRAHVFCGTPHDDKLYLCESIILEKFRSPLAMSFVVPSSSQVVTQQRNYARPGESSQDNLVSYLMIDDLIGVDQVITRKLSRYPQRKSDSLNPDLLQPSAQHPRIARRRPIGDDFSGSPKQPAVQKHPVQLNVSDGRTGEQLAVKESSFGTCTRLATPEMHVGTPLQCTSSPEIIDLALKSSIDGARMSTNSVIIPQLKTQHRGNVQPTDKSVQHAQLLQSAGPKPGFRNTQIANWQATADARQVSLNDNTSMHIPETLCTLPQMLYSNTESKELGIVQSTQQSKGYLKRKPIDPPRPDKEGCSSSCYTESGRTGVKPSRLPGFKDIPLVCGQPLQSAAQCSETIHAHPSNDIMKYPSDQQNAFSAFRFTLGAKSTSRNLPSSKSVVTCPSATFPVGSGQLRLDTSARRPMHSQSVSQDKNCSGKDAEVPNSLLSGFCGAPRSIFEAFPVKKLVPSGVAGSNEITATKFAKSTDSDRKDIDLITQHEQTSQCTASVFEFL